MAHMSSEPDASDEAVKEQGEHLSDDSTESLRSSPPLLETDQTVIEDETKLNNKRSHEEMNEDPQNVFASSATMIGDVASSAVPSRDLDEPPPKPVNPSSAAHSMRPPALPASSMLPPSQKPPTSAQMPRNPNPVPAPPTKPENVQREESSFEDHDEPQDPGDSAVDSPGDPQDPIEEFEWRKLHERYHAKMQELDGQESEVMNEFHQLCQFFAIWSNAGSNREVDRSFKRLKTQATYVQNKEDELEEKRLHYIRVVEAFKSALELLSR